MTSQLNVDTIVDKSGTGTVTLTKQEAAKLRCRFNQAAPAGVGTLEVGSLNVSSVNDDSKGLFTVSITSSMSDSLYGVSGFAGEHGNVNDATWLSKYSAQNDFSTSAAPFATWYYAGDFRDSERNSVLLFGDLA